MLPCVEFVERVTDVTDGAASRRLWLAFQLHRLACAYCRRYLRQMRAIRGALRRREDARHRDEDPPAVLR